MITPAEARQILLPSELDAEIERRIDAEIQRACLCDSWPVRLFLHGTGGLLSLDEALPARVLAAGVDPACKRVLAKFRAAGWRLEIKLNGPERGFLQLERP